VFKLILAAFTKPSFLRKKKNVQYIFLKKTENLNTAPIIHTVIFIHTVLCDTFFFIVIYLRLSNYTVLPTEICITKQRYIAIRSWGIYKTADLGEITGMYRLSVSPQIGRRVSQLIGATHI